MSNDIPQIKTCYDVLVNPSNTLDAPIYREILTHAIAHALGQFKLEVDGHAKESTHGGCMIYILRRAFGLSAAQINWYMSQLALRAGRALDEVHEYGDKLLESRPHKVVSMQDIAATIGEEVAPGVIAITGQDKISEFIAELLKLETPTGPEANKPEDPTSN